MSNSRREWPARIGRGRAARIAAALLAGITGSSAITPAMAGADILVAGAAARGFFGWDAIAGYERKLPVKNIPEESPLDLPLRIEGHFAYKDNVTHIALSTYVLVRYVIPGFEENGFGPYLATGPGAHILGSWSNLESFGDVLSDAQATLKWHALVGARLARGRTFDLYTEARYTLPSEYTFDYVAVGIRFRAANDDSARAGS